MGGINEKMKGRVCLITGANSGLGKSLSMALAGYGARVLMICRGEEKGSRARSEIVEKTLATNYLAPFLLSH